MKIINLISGFYSHLDGEYKDFQIEAENRFVKIGEYYLFPVRNRGNEDAATCGENLEDAREMAKNILSIYIEDEGEKEPKDINEVDLAELYKERTNLTLDQIELEKAHKEYITL